jgi:hypothetical protein
MYPLACVGDNATARAAIAACHKAGFSEVTWVAGAAPGDDRGAHTLPANISRIVTALDGNAALEEFGHQPDRQQVRLATSGFLLSELPLGPFSRERYGAPHVNIEASDWPRLLPVAKEVALRPHQPLAELDHAFAAVLVCTPETEISSSQPPATHKLWHARLPLDASMSKANITWLGQRQTAWQFSTRVAQHVYFSVPLNMQPQAKDWHPLLHAAVAAAAPDREFCAYTDAVREHWHAGAVVYLGPACCPANPFLREAQSLGLEDAWVLSRMLENYEEDVQEGFREYEKYRRARTRRVATAAARRATDMTRKGRISRFLSYLNVALSSRFLPEIAMHRIDWFYGHDCIRGFR